MNKLLLLCATSQDSALETKKVRGENALRYSTMIAVPMSDQTSISHIVMWMEIVLPWSVADFSDFSLRGAIVFSISDVTLYTDIVMAFLVHAEIEFLFISITINIKSAPDIISLHTSSYITINRHNIYKVATLLRGVSSMPLVKHLSPCIK